MQDDMMIGQNLTTKEILSSKRVKHLNPGMRGCIIAEHHHN